MHLSGPLTRSELAARTGLNRSTVGALVGELASVGLACESAPPSRGGTGRPSLLVSLAADRVWVLAVEIGPDVVAVARVGLGGAVHGRLAQRRDWDEGLTPASAVATIGRLARKLMGRAPAGSQLVGAAVAVPGIVRRSDGFVHLAPNLLWHDVPLGSLLSSRLPGPPASWSPTRLTSERWPNAPEAPPSAPGTRSTSRATPVWEGGSSSRGHCSPAGPVTPARSAT